MTLSRDGGAKEGSDAARCDDRGSGRADVGPVASDHGLRGGVGFRILVALGSLHVARRREPRLPRDMGGLDADRRRNDAPTLWTAGVPDHLSAPIPLGTDGCGGRPFERRTAGPGPAGWLGPPRTPWRC